jgi:hypothetical protein
LRDRSDRSLLEDRRLDHGRPLAEVGLLGIEGGRDRVIDRRVD